MKRFYYIALFGVLLVPTAMYIFSVNAYEIPKMVLMYILAGLSGLFLIDRLISRQPVLVHKKALIAWLIFILVNLLASFFAKDKVFAFFSGRYIEGIVFYLAVLLLLLGFFQVEKKYWRNLLNVLVWQSFFVSLLALIQAFFQVATYDYLKIVLIRPTTTLGSASFLAIYLCPVIVANIYLLTVEQARYKKWLYALILFVNIWAFVMSGSRAAWVAMAVVLVAIVLQLWRFDRKKALVALAALATFAIIFMAFGLLSRSDRMQDIFSSSDVNIYSRLEVYKLALRATKEHLLLGLGPNNFAIYYFQNRPFKLGDYLGFFDQAHNFILQNAVNAGILGVAALFYFFFFVFKRIKQILFAEFNLEAVALFSVAGIWLCAMLGPLDVASWFFLVLFSAWLLSADLSELQLAPKALASLRLAHVGCFLLIFFSLTYAAADQFLFYGRRMYFENKFASAHRLLKIGQFLDPFETGDYFFNAATYAKQNQASTDLNKIVLLDPNFPYSYIHRASITLYVAERQNNKTLADQGFRDFKKAISMDQNDYSLLLGYSGWLAKFGYIDQAIPTLQEVVRLNPEQKSAHMILASLYNKKGDRDKFLSEMETAYRIDALDMPLKHFIQAQRKSAKIIPYSVNYESDILE